MRSDEYVIHGPEPLSDNYPDNYSTLGTLMIHSLKKHGNKICMVDAITKEQISFAQLLKKSIQVAESLKLICSSRNDTIAICSENHVNYFIPVIAATYLGLAVSPLNHNSTIPELIHCLNISKPKIVFCSTGVVEKIKELQNLPYVKQIVTINHNNENFQDLEEFSSLSKKEIDINSFEPMEFNSKENIAFILYSSGTTGLAKGVKLTHYNMLAAMSNLHDCRFYAPKEVFLAMLPLFHVFGMNTTLAAIVRGTLSAVLNKFEFELFLKTVQDYKIPYLMLVPPILVLLAKSPAVDKYDLSCVREIGAAGAPMSQELQDAVIKRLNLRLLEQGYGLTEMSTAILKPQLNNLKSGSIGMPLPFVDAKICHIKTGKSLGPGQQGEMCFRGALVMKGYVDNEKATKEMIDDDGWLHSGDVGYYDEERFFYIVDRIKELIKYKGHQVAPAELERLLLSHPSIKDAAVVGKPDELSGEVPVAFVVKQPGKLLTASEVQQFITKLVSPFKRLRGGVMFVEEIPKNPSGKILRKELRNLLQQKSKL